jgi:hypothetical protein
MDSTLCHEYDNITTLYDTVTSRQDPERSDEGAGCTKGLHIRTRIPRSYRNTNRRSFERYNGEAGDRHLRHSTTPEGGQLVLQH